MPLVQLLYITMRIYGSLQTKTEKLYMSNLRFIRRRGTSRNNKWADNIPNGKMIPLQGNKNIKYTKDKGVLTP